MDQGDDAFVGASQHDFASSAQRPKDATDVFTLLLDHFCFRTVTSDDADRLVGPAPDRRRILQQNSTKVIDRERIRLGGENHPNHPAAVGMEVLDLGDSHRVVDCTNLRGGLRAPQNHDTN